MNRYRVIYYTRDGDTLEWTVEAATEDDALALIAQGWPSKRAVRAIAVTGAL